jgi:hypothetical protein
MPFFLSDIPGILPHAYAIFREGFDSNRHGSLTILGKITIATALAVEEDGTHPDFDMMQRHRRR